MLYLGQPTSLLQAPSWFLEIHNELFISLHCFKTISPKTLPRPYQVPLWISSWSPLALLKTPSQSLERHNEFVTLVACFKTWSTWSCLERHNEFFTLVACFKAWSTETQHMSSPWSCLETITRILLFDYSLKSWFSEDQLETSLDMESREPTPRPREHGVSRELTLDPVRTV